MRGFKNFVETMGDDYWASRMSQFQAAASGTKNAIVPEPNKEMPKYRSGTFRRPIIPNTPKTIKTLTPQEVQRLGIHANHQLVWIGSTADAPPTYQYVYVKRTGKFLTNPAYTG